MVAAQLTVHAYVPILQGHEGTLYTWCSRSLDTDFIYLFAGPTNVGKEQVWIQGG